MRVSFTKVAAKQNNQHKKTQVRKQYRANLKTLGAIQTRTVKNAKKKRKHEICIPIHIFRRNSRTIWDVRLIKRKQNKKLGKY